jgi:transposase InsO family protein
MTPSHEPPNDSGSPPRSAAEAHHQLRRQAVDLWQSAAAEGETCGDVSRRLEVAPRTMRRWKASAASAAETSSALPEPGRPRFQLDRQLLHEIRQAIRELGLHTGVETFKARFAHVPRRVLAAVKEHYRSVVARWRRRSLARLEWTQPGRVWAIDHAQPPLTMDHKYDYLLSVRDLGSGLQLAWEPIRRADADTTIDLLSRLFAEHGPPLVLKSDNGKALTQGGIPALLSAHGVTPLISPVYRPQYNGSCEAGVKAMKVRTEDIACLADRSRHWTADDLDQALRIANEYHHSSPRAPTHQERWRQRSVITPEERTAFQSALAETRACLHRAHGEPLTKTQVRTVERSSVAQTLVESGLLIIHRRHNTSSKETQKAAIIS